MAIQINKLKAVNRKALLRFPAAIIVNLVQITARVVLTGSQATCGFRLLMLGLLLGVFGSGSAFAGLTITSVTWNVIGLDSNRPVTDGPELFPVGARVCNTGGGAVSNILSNFVWDSSNSLINLNVPSTLTYPSLAAGRCIDFYFDVIVTRTAAAHNTTRRFHITASGDGVSAVSTPTPRELYVEKILSQARNTVVSISGPTTVYVGQTYTYTVNADTAPQGYEQLQTHLTLSNVVFRVLSVATTYSAPAGGTNNKIYADGCGWDNNPLNTATYRSCVGPENYPGGKAGGTIQTTYTVQVMSTGETSASTLILDFSGSSYHYNADYGVRVLSITALPPPTPNLSLTKSVSPLNNQLPGTDLTYSIGFTNTGTGSAANLVITDPNRSTSLKLNDNTDFKVGSVVNNLGTSGLSAAAVAYSNDGGGTFNYTPISGAGGAPAGYDRNVTHIRWTFTGSLLSIPPNNTGSVSFVVRIR